MMLTVLSVAVHAAVTVGECNQDDFRHCIARYNHTIDFASRVAACVRSTDVCVRYPFGMLTMMPSQNASQHSVVGPAQVTDYPIQLQGTPSIGQFSTLQIGNWCFPSDNASDEICDGWYGFYFHPNESFVPDGLRTMIRISGGAMPYDIIQPNNVTYSVNSSNVEDLDRVTRARAEITVYRHADKNKAYFTLQQLASLRMAVEFKGELYASPTAPPVTTHMCVTFAQFKWEEPNHDQGSVEFQIWPYDAIVPTNFTDYHTNGSYRDSVVLSHVRIGVF